MGGKGGDGTVGVVKVTTTPGLLGRKKHEEKKERHWNHLSSSDVVVVCSKQLVPDAAPIEEPFRDSQQRPRLVFLYINVSRTSANDSETGTGKVKGSIGLGGNRSCAPAGTSGRSPVG